MISPQFIQKLASAATDDMQIVTARIYARVGMPVVHEQISDMAKLAGIGGRGTRPNACRGDLGNLMPSMVLKVPDPVRLPLKAVGAANGFINALQWVVWPHELFIQIYHSFKPSWKNLIICH